jgi:hypothetical protein
MSVSRVASAAALLGGLAWMLAGMVGRGGDADGPVYDAGLVLVVVAFAALGYSLVETAPVWLRALVTVATPALACMVWVTVRDAFSADYLPVLAAGLVLAAAAGVGLARARKQRPPAGVRGRRAAR